MIDTSNCQEYFDSVKKFAQDNNLLQEFLDKVEYLNSYACSTGETTNLELTKCMLYKDFAPQSFVFDMYQLTMSGEYKRWFNGGLIFHPAGSSGVSGEMSVRIGDCSKAAWSIHT